MTVTPGSAELAHSAIRLLALAEKLEGPQCLVSADDRAIAAAACRLAAKPADEDHPDCITARECELYDALMGLASHATAYHDDYKQWTQGGVTLEPIVTRALRLSPTGAPK